MSPLSQPEEHTVTIIKDGKSVTFTMTRERWLELEALRYARDMGLSDEKAGFVR